MFLALTKLRASSVSLTASNILLKSFESANACKKVFDFGEAKKSSMMTGIFSTSPALYAFCIFPCTLLANLIPLFTLPATKNRSVASTL